MPAQAGISNFVTGDFREGGNDGEQSYYFSGSFL